MPQMTNVANARLQAFRQGAPLEGLFFFSREQSFTKYPLLAGVPVNSRKQFWLLEYFALKPILESGTKGEKFKDIHFRRTFAHFRGHSV